MARQIYWGNPPVSGLAKAIKVDKLIFVAGTTAYRNDKDLPSDMAEQMRMAYTNIAGILAHFGASLADVVEQTVFVTDMDEALAARHVRIEAYGASGNDFPVSATVEVSRLGRPGLKVEIKVSAVLDR
jgi:enamine deaminase RidA (YjgF/YER057c/UK114 family)